MGWTIEVLIVDNGSTDDTRAVISDASSGNSLIRYLSEPAAGVSRARNRGLRESAGKVILFTDDDVRVPTHWLKGMCEKILKGEADAVAGGIIFPAHIAYAFHEKPLNARRGWFASSDYLNPDNPKSMIGANMAFSRRVLEKVPGFDLELGPGGVGSGEETLFCKQLRTAGYRLAGALNVTVEHHFDLRRTSREALLELARIKGRTAAFILYHWEHQPVPLHIPKLGIFHLARQLVRLISKAGQSVERRTFGGLLRFEEKVTFLEEYRRQQKRSRKYAHHGLTPLT
ncbi:MAG: protein/glycosyl transferase [Verrucomicrobia bacterium]|nr:protein/glycosyl transferase [Verrucomicrobiota bacterium]